MLTVIHGSSKMQMNLGLPCFIGQPRASCLFSPDPSGIERHVHRGQSESGRASGEAKARRLNIRVPSSVGQSRRQSGEGMFVKEKGRIREGRGTGALEDAQRDRCQGPSQRGSKTRLSIWLSEGEPVLETETLRELQVWMQKTDPLQERPGASSPGGHPGSSVRGFRDGEGVVLSDGAPAASETGWKVPCGEDPRCRAGPCLHFPPSAPRQGCGRPTATRLSPHSLTCVPKRDSSSLWLQPVEPKGPRCFPGCMEWELRVLPAF